MLNNILQLGLGTTLFFQLQQVSASDGAGLAALFQLGAIGAVLAFVLLRIEPRMARIEASLDRLTRAQMLTLISRPETEEAVKRQANQVLLEMGDASTQFTQKP